MEVKPHRMNLRSPLPKIYYYQNNKDLFLHLIEREFCLLSFMGSKTRFSRLKLLFLIAVALY